LSLWRTVAHIILVAALASAEASPAAIPIANESSSWRETVLNLPVVRWFIPPQLQSPSEPAQPAAVCGIALLHAISDPQALSFENSTSPDVGGLLPAMARALEKFKQLVASVGGHFELKSAYRPPSYQAHLQEVWYKWMELRNNHDPGCQILRAQVGDEFARHHLLESQQPVTDSDHSRGMAFDAAVTVPAKAMLKRRRVSLDRLALLAGIRRPDIRRDPVHFKLYLTGARVSSARGARRV
jgi:hypothetical protein